MTPARFLVVEDDPRLARCLAQITRRHGETTVVGTAGDADVALEGYAVWSGLIIDIGLPDGSGLDLLARARRRHPATPALVQTGSLERVFINRAYDLGADYVVKPVVSQRIDWFARCSASASHPLALAARVDRVLQVWCSQYRLSEAQVDVLRRTAMGEDRATIARERQSSPLTIKTQVATLLKLTGDASLHAAVERILRSVAQGPSSPTGRCRQCPG